MKMNREVLTDNLKEQNRIRNLPPEQQRNILFEHLFAKTTYFFELRALPSKKREFTRDINKIETFVQRYIKENIYFGTYTRLNKSSGKKENIAEVTCYFADLDFKLYSGGEDEAWNTLQAFEFEPSLVVHTGNGLHAYWFFNHVIEPADKVEAILKGMAKLLKSDPAVAEIARVLRIPGTYNYKDNSKKPVSIVYWSGNENVQS